MTETPDLDHMSNDDLCALLLACALSNDPSDRAFAKACRDELARRKPDRARVDAEVSQVDAAIASIRSALGASTTGDGNG